MTLLQRIGRAGQGIAAGWDEGDVERVWQGLRRKRRRRAFAAGAGLLSAAAGLVVVAGVVFRPGGAVTGGAPGSGLAGEVRAPAVAGPPVEAARPITRARQVEPAPDGRRSDGPASSAERTLRLSDGSTVVSWGADPGALTVVEDGPRRVRVALARGGARFDVVRRPGRVFSVRAGEVTVSVLGTAFTVERVADRVGVVVTRGAVLVDWRVGSRRLGGGERESEGWFPPLVVAPRSAAARTPGAPLVKDGRRARRAVERSEASGAPEPLPPALARNETPPRQGAAPLPVAPPVERRAPQGDIRAEPPGVDRVVPVASPTGRPESGREVSPPSASTSGTLSPPAPEREEASAGALLANADRARLAGRFEEGASLLRRLVREYPADQRAPLAAFSLGRLLLGELGRPGDAARAFARARALAPDGPLAEDALAREAEAWARAKDVDRARARAAEYARTYPNGRRAADVTDAVGRATAGSSP